MSEKDKTQKSLEELNDVFADIANVLMFNGEEVINRINYMRLIHTLIILRQER